MKKRSVFKKVMIGILSAILIVLFVYALFIEIIPRIHKKDDIEISEESESWMRNIDDDILISDISIPGIHDACATNLKLDAFGKCQDYDVLTLLECGYRYIDLRLGVDKNNELYLCHGFLSCMSGNGFFNKNLELDSVVDDILNFLNDNPSETIILVAKYEHGSVSKADFQFILEDYIDNKIPDEKILYTQSIPTMGESRGKIVLCRRYFDYAEIEMKAGLMLKWVEQEESEVSECPYEYGYGFYGYEVAVQDRYKYSALNKWNAFKETMEETPELLKEGVVINFLSTNGTMVYGFPHIYAKKLNKQFIEEYRDKKVYGWIIVDFGTDEIAKIIYQSNWM